MSGGGFFGGMASGIEGQQKHQREERELGIREDALKNTQKRELSGEVDKAINGTMLIVAKTIEESRKAGAPPDKVLQAVKPLLADIAGLAKNAGRDPGIYARQAEALLTIPHKPEKPDELKSPLGQLVKDRALMAAGGADQVTLRQFDLRIKREAEGAEKNAFASEHQLRNEFTAQDKGFRQVDANFKGLTALTATPSVAGDIGVIYKYHKMLDPTSQVTEGEFKKAENARPLLEGLGLDWGSIQAVWAGKGLTVEQRKDFLNQAKNLHTTAKTENDKLINRYRDIATRNGIDPTNVVPESPAPGPKAGRTPPAAMIEYLRQNRTDPKTVKDFETYYGRSAAPFLD